MKTPTMILVPAKLTIEMYRRMMAMTEEAPHICIRERPSNPVGEQWEVISMADATPDVTVLHRVGSEEEADELKEFEEISLGWNGMVAVVTGAYDKSE